MARHDLSDLSDADLARLLGAKGRHGDTAVVHVNPQEISLLKALGGSGTRNPKTGLLEFFAGGPGGVGRDGGGAVAGGASGIGGRGADGGNGSEHGGYGGGTISSPDGPSISRTKKDMGGFSMDGGNARTASAVITNTSDLGMLRRALEGQPTVDLTTQDGVVRGILGAMGLISAAPMGTAAQLGTAMGEAAKNKIGAIEHGAQPGSVVDTNQGKIGVQGGDAYGGNINSGTTDVAGLTHDIANGSFTGGDISKYGRDHNNGGDNRFDRDNVIKNAQQANAGGGLLAALNPAGQPTTPGLPAGLLQYLAQNPGLLQGLVANTRFGTGTVAPISYGQPLA